MKKEIHILSVTLILILTICASIAVAQESEVDICVLEHLTAKELTGKVVSARLGNEIEQPLPGAVVELRRIGELQVIAKTITDANGQFSLPDVPNGAYSLAAKPPSSSRVTLFSTAVEVRYSSTKTKKQDKEIVLALGWLFNGCHGGYAAVRSKHKQQFLSKALFRAP